MIVREVLEGLQLDPMMLRAAVIHLKAVILISSQKKIMIVNLWMGQQMLAVNNGRIQRSVFFWESQIL